MLLGMVPFMGAGIDFKWSVVVSNRNNLLKVNREKRGNRTSLLILERVEKLVGQKPDAPMPMANIDSVTKGHADRVWPNESSCECRLTQLRVFRPW